MSDFKYEFYYKDLRKLQVITFLSQKPLVLEDPQKLNKFKQDI